MKAKPCLRVDLRTSWGVQTSPQASTLLTLVICEGVVRIQRGSWVRPGVRAGKPTRKLPSQREMDKLVRQRERAATGRSWAGKYGTSQALEVWWTRLGQASVRTRREARPELYTVVRVEPVSSESRKIIKLIGKLLKNTSEKHSYNTLCGFLFCFLVMRLHCLDSSKLRNDSVPSNLFILLTKLAWRSYMTCVKSQTRSPALGETHPGQRALPQGALRWHPVCLSPGSFKPYVEFFQIWGVPTKQFFVGWTSDL